MNISVEQTIHLTTKNTQLSLLVLDSGHLLLGYFGKKIGEVSLAYVVEEIQRASYMADTDGIKDFKLEQLPNLYPAFGNPDLRTPAHLERDASGSAIADFRYKSHSFSNEKKPLKELPYCQSQEDVTTLTIILEDALTKNELAITLSAFEKQDVFTQSVCYHNHSEATIQIENMQSLSLDFLSDRFDLITLNGAWGRETKINRRPLVQGIQGVDSKRGASGHGQNPFIALVDPQTNDEQVTAIACSLLYSGNFQASAEVDMHQNTRLQIGINPFQFSWELVSGDSFTTPEAVFFYTDQGLNTLSQTFHRFYQNCLLRGPWAKKSRPVLLNSWETFYFDFNREKLEKLAEKAKEIGIECFVVDDGWFSKRADSSSSLGDWVPNEAKLGGSLTDVIQSIHQKKMLFGLWLEPEMVSPDSDLYRNHPDWIIQSPGRTPQLIREQYVLDLSLKEVQDHLIVVLTTLLKTYKIDYIKWDMNRNMTDLWSGGLPANRQNELAHRYILGLYRILEEVTQAFPHVLFESCAGGGGRFDPGMLYYMPQTWTSDDSDAISRLSIQEGTSFVYPPVAMSCHVSAVPNHQLGRMTSLNTRTTVAQQGNFGYELDLNQLSKSEEDELKQQIVSYKKERETLQFGIHYRLSPYDKNQVAWQKKNEKTGDIIVSHVTILVQPNTVQKRLKLEGLNPQASYSFENTVRTGSELMEIGLMIPRPSHDFYASQWFLKKVKE